MNIAKERRKKKKFIRQDSSSYKRIRDKWRRPKGTQSKMRKKMKGKGIKPSPGYGAPKKIKNLHPSGFEEVLVFCLKDLNGLNPKTHACRIGSSVGRKKKFDIMKVATENQIKVLNPAKMDKEKK